MQRLPTTAIKEVDLCVGAIQAGGQRQSEVWRVDKDEETAMFGERTGESDANLYPTNWKQQSPAPEPHSRPCGQCQAPGQRGRVMRAGGWRDGMEVRVSVNGSLVVSVPADGTEFGVCAHTCRCTVSGVVVRV